MDARDRQNQAAEAPALRALQNGDGSVQRADADGSQTKAAGPLIHAVDAVARRANPGGGRVCKAVGGMISLPPVGQIPLEHFSAWLKRAVGLSANILPLNEQSVKIP
jgi:hypothetical protein